MSEKGLISSYPLLIHSHQDEGEGGTINPEIGLSPFPKVNFGDGSDGDVAIGADTVLSRDMSYKDLTVRDGFKLYANGFIIRVRGKLTVESGAEILANNNISLDGGHGDAIGGGGAAGLAGYTTRRPFRCLPRAGTAGGNGGLSGPNNSNGGLSSNSVLTEAASVVMGALWAGGGGAGGGAHGATPTTPATPFKIVAGAVGGRGGDAIATGLSTLGGGGGGGGNGLLEIWANEVDNTGLITAIGGNGGNGADAGVGEEAGGGGGGGGGGILLFYKVVSGAGIGSLVASRGAKGSGGSNGANGADGYTYAMKIGQ